LAIGGLADDILEGGEEIGKFLFGDNDPNAKQKAYYLASEVPPAKRIPTFRLGGKLCSRKSTLLRHITVQEQRSTTVGK
jgi:hypothetical protein